MTIALKYVFTGWTNHFTTSIWRVSFSLSFFASQEWYFLQKPLSLAEITKSLLLDYTKWAQSNHRRDSNHEKDSTPYFVVQKLTQRCKSTICQWRKVFYDCTCSIWKFPSHDWIWATGMTYATAVAKTRSFNPLHWAGNQTWTSIVTQSTTVRLLTCCTLMGTPINF